MQNNSGIIATEVLILMKKSVKRMYLLLIIFITLFVLSMIDSIYQRCRIIDVLEQYESMVDKSLEVIEQESELEHNHEE
jgi:hypothetical protein